MGVEQHCYGVACGCISRRHFVMYFCAASGAFSVLQLLGFFYGYYWAADGVETAADAAAERGCTGTVCYEVWSCLGWKDATQHLREPLAEIAGTVLCSMGFLGAMYGNKWQLRMAGYWILILGLAYLAATVFDAAYTEVCGAYPTNLVRGTLTQRIPPSPIGLGTQQKLRSMTVYHVAVVDRLTDGFNALAWYLALAVSWSLFVIYGGSETQFLGELVERGPIGLGMNYGLGQWDEVINHDAIRIQKDKLQRSQFIDDAELPLPFAVDKYGPSHGFPYGATEVYAPRRAPFAHLPVDRKSQAPSSNKPAPPTASWEATDDLEDALLVL